MNKKRHLSSCVFPSSATAMKPCTTLPFICLGRRFEQDLKTLSRAFLVAMSGATLGDRRSLRGTWILIGLLAAYLLGTMAAFCGVRCSSSVGNRFHPDRFFLATLLHHGGFTTFHAFTWTKEAASAWCQRCSNAAPRLKPCQFYPCWMSQRGRLRWSLRVVPSSVRQRLPWCGA